MNLLVTGAFQITPSQIEELESLGHTVVIHKNESDELTIDHSEIEGVICNALFLYHDIKKFGNLRYIQLTSAGLDRVPLEYIREKGIKLNSARGVYSIPMAEFALTAVLDVYKNVEHFRVAQRERRWDKYRGIRELHGKRACIVGCGSVGDECAKRFLAMGCEVFGIDACPREDSMYSKIFHTSKICDVLPMSDIVILTLPLSSDTYHLIGAKELDLLPDGCVLVNISRGGVVDTDSLIDSLRKRDIVAVLDVFEEEPLSSDSSLWNLPNALLTPHNSFVGEGNGERLWNSIIKNFKDI